MCRYRLTVDNLLRVDLVTADWTVTPLSAGSPSVLSFHPGAS